MDVVVEQFVVVNCYIFVEMRTVHRLRHIEFHEIISLHKAPFCRNRLDKCFFDFSKTGLEMAGPLVWGGKEKHMVEKAIMISILVGVFILGFIQDLRLIRIGYSKLAVSLMVLHIGFSIWTIVAMIGE